MAASQQNFKTVPCRYKQYSFNPLNQLTFARQIYKLKPDLVHFTMAGQQPLFYFGPQITFSHDLTMLKYTRRGRLPKWLHWLRMRGYRLLLHEAHRRALKILVPTEYVSDAIHKYHLFTGRKLVVLSEASEPPLPGKAIIPEALKTYLQSPTSKLSFILYVGTSFPHKNLRRLIKAYGIIREKHPETKLVLVGKQEYHAKKLMRWAKKLDYAEDIIFTGFVPDSDLKWLYENAKCYVFPSLSEGFGLPGLEAMVHGCPVASSNATCLPEVYGEAAHYFDPEDTSDIAEKVLEVINRPGLRAKLIKDGYTQTKKFSWRKMSEQTLEIYKELINPAAN